MKRIKIIKTLPWWQQAVYIGLGAIIIIIGALLLFGYGIITPYGGTSKVKGTVTGFHIVEAKRADVFYLNVTLDNGEAVRAQAPIGSQYKNGEKVILIETGNPFSRAKAYKLFKYAGN
jgi:hypothetical protein